MALLTTQISALLASGADAMDNLFDVDITLPDAVQTVAPAGKLPFAIRCLDFIPPKFTLKTYPMPYKTTAGVKRSAGKLDGERSFQLRFRLDAYYVVYRLLLAWKSGYSQSATGYASSLINTIDGNQNSFLGRIQVNGADSPVAQEVGKGYTAEGITQDEMASLSLMASSGVTANLSWVFQNVWVIDVDAPKFVTGGGDIQIVAATFGFGSYTDSQVFDRQYGTSGEYTHIIPSASPS